MAARKGENGNTYTDKLFARIMSRIAEGESIASICRDKSMPSSSNFYKWLEDKPELQERYAYARELQAEKIFGEILDIADDSDGDEDNAENVQRSRLRVDARKWVVARLAPKKYGDRMAIDHTVKGSLAERFARADKRTADE